MILPDLFSLAKHPDRLEWETFRPGVDIHRLYGNGQKGPSAALLKYSPGATIPEHDHTGHEYIMVLSGAQSDARGIYPAGTFVVNPPGSHHNIKSETGCIVLIIWEKPVSIRKKSDV